jgi:hypothetical protein
MNEIVPHTPSPGGVLLEVIARAATDERVNIEKMMALLEMQNRILDRDALEQFNAAMADFNHRCDLRVSKLGTASLGGKGSYSFAKWEDMDAVIRPVMRELGLWFSFDVVNGPSGLHVKGTLHHRGGHTQTASLPMPIDSGPGRNPLQQIGSTLSYGKRYCAEMLLNIVREDEDDDGHAAAAGRRPAAQTRYTPDPEPPARAAELTFEQKVSAALNDQPDGGKWIKLFVAACERAETADQLNYITAMSVVRKTMDQAPSTIRAILQDALTKAVNRLSPKMPPEPEPEADVVTYVPDAEMDAVLLVDHIREEVAEITELTTLNKWSEGAGREVLRGLRERSPKCWGLAAAAIDARRIALGG